MSFDMLTVSNVRGVRASGAMSVATVNRNVRKVAARRRDGTLICLSDLPEDGARWTRLRKRAVIECLDNGLIDLEAVCARYDLTRSEIAEWRAAAADNGRAPVLWRDRPRRKISGRVICGGLDIRIEDELVLRKGRLVSLSPSERKIIIALAQADGAVVTSAMIMGVLYSRIEEAAVPKIADVLMCRLRKKLGEDGDRVIAVWGRGYRLDL